MSVEATNVATDRSRRRRAAAATAVSYLLFVAILLLVHGARPVLQLDVSGDPRASMDGFYGAEHLDGVRWAWTAPRATVVLPSIDRRVPWRWTSRILMIRPGPVTLRLSIDGIVAVDEVVSQNHQVVEAEIPPRERVRGLTVTLDAAPGFAPGNNDPRVLGLAFESIELAPKNGRVWPEVHVLLWGLLVSGLTGATLTILGVRLAVLYGGLAVAATGQAWWLARAGVVYGPYPASSIAFPVGCWFALVVALRAYDWFPAAWLNWRARTGALPGAVVVGGIQHTIRRWLDRPALARAYALGI